MFKGFYNLASGMITQGKNLDVISNNMTNIATSGFKADRFTAQTFDDVLWSLVGNKEKVYTGIGNQSYMTVPSELYTDYTQGSFDQTDLPLDFAIEGDGFFAVQTVNGVAYTRSGSFSLDEEGYLGLPGFGRVLDMEGNEIYLNTDKITADNYGRLYTEDGFYLAQLGVYTFADNMQLEKNELGLFDSDAAAQATQTRIHHGMVERSNVDLVEQMVSMISSQRAYQSAARVATMYDQLMTKATTDLGRLS